MSGWGELREAISSVRVTDDGVVGFDAVVRLVDGFEGLERDRADAYVGGTLTRAAQETGDGPVWHDIDWSFGARCHRKPLRASARGGLLNMDMVRELNNMARAWGPLGKEVLRAAVLMSSEKLDPKFRFNLYGWACEVWRSLVRARLQEPCLSSDKEMLIVFQSIGLHHVDEVAERADIPRRTLTRWIQGAAKLSNDERIAVRDVLKQM
jgi:hypothetical protein